eukprot:SAG11_NODE_2904_length_2845_cov_13.583333_2_plen_182_part_00
MRVYVCGSGSGGSFPAATIEHISSQSVNCVDSALLFGCADGGAAPGHFSEKSITGRCGSSALFLLMHRLQFECGKSFVCGCSSMSDCHCGRKYPGPAINEELINLVEPTGTRGPCWNVHLFQNIVQSKCDQNLTTGASGMVLSILSRHICIYAGDFRFRFATLRVFLYAVPFRLWNDIIFW